MQSEAAPTIVEIPSAATISEGFEKYANAAWYSVCRSTSEGVRLGLLPVQGESCSGKALYVYAWNSRLEKVFDLTVSVVDAILMEQWERDELKLSFIDAPISKFVPNEGIHKDLRDVGMNEDMSGLIHTVPPRSSRRDRQKRFRMAVARTWQEAVEFPRPRTLAVLRRHL